VLLKIKKITNRIIHKSNGCWACEQIAKYWICRRSNRRSYSSQNNLCYSERWSLRTTV